ncbi:MAG: hypothetical protein M1822_005054 [Bathelium mastoideum]|nr:MAG: hypothetical protein M1822_005054 [Bathelium mastoideum]
MLTDPEIQPARHSGVEKLSLEDNGMKDTDSTASSADESPATDSSETLDPSQVKERDPKKLKENRSESGRIRHIASRTEASGRREQVPGVWPPEENDTVAAECAATFKEIFNSSNQRDYFEVTIDDPDLTKFIKETLGSWFEHTGPGWSKPQPTISSSDLSLVHNWETLREAAESAHPKSGDLKEFLQDFEKIAHKSLEQHQLYTYDGLALVEKVHPMLGHTPPERFDFFHLRWDPEREEIIVDFKSYAQAGLGPAILNCGNMRPSPTASCVCKFCSGNGDWGKWAAALKSGSDVIPEWQRFFAFFPPRVLGYALRTKEWAQFSVSKVRNKSWKEQDKAWKSLKIDEPDKERISSLVRNHVKMSEGDKDLDSKDMVRDPIDKKGRGLVLLFHGVPGVGKTLTAEALAVEIQKPLLKVGAKELDYRSAATTSRNLEVFFKLARLWGAILDEADVFLRDRQELNTNEAALVSEMLRALEYFEGVLIMTTNRVKSVDLAMQSRIHLAVMYGELEGIRSRQVWESFIEQLKPGKNATEEEIERIKDFVQKDKDDWGPMGPDRLNGRQIRNIFTLAQTLAQDHNGFIKLDDIKDSFKSTVKFRDQLRQFSTQRQDQYGVSKDEAQGRGYR